MAKPKKKEKPTREQYRSVSEYGTAEQRLMDAVVSQGRGVGEFMDLLSAMRTNDVAPIASAGGAFSFGDADGNSSAGTRYQGTGRSFLSESGNLMYQPASDVPGEYFGTGRAVQVSDIGAITGNMGRLSGSQQRNVVQMLRDPAVMQYFMDIYGEAGGAYKPRTVTLKQNTSGDMGTGGKNNTINVVDRPKGKIDKSCKGPKCWQ